MPMQLVHCRVKLPSARGLAEIETQLLLELPGHLVFARQIARQGAAQAEDVASLCLRA